MAYHVYALASTKHDWIYVGMTEDVNRRLEEHQKGYEKTTKPYRPFVLIFTEVCEDRIAARQREKYWKGASGKRKLRFIRNVVLGGSNLPD
jgi:putative endonuclease